VGVESMKILFVAGLDPLLAQGHASHVRHLVDELAARGHQVDVIARDEAGTLSWNAPGRLDRLSRIPIPVLGQFMLELRTAWTIRKWAAEDTPDVVLARSETLAFAALATPTSLPLAVESNASQVRHSEEGRSGSDGTPRSRLIAKIERMLFRRAVRIGVVAPSLRDIHAEIHGFDRERFFVVRNGARVPPPLDHDSIRAQRRAGPSEGTRQDLEATREFVIALSGSASQRIEFAWLLHAIESNERARLWVMGRGELWDTWEESAKKSTASARIDFLGALPEEEAERFCQSAQIVAAPYADGRLESLGGDPLKVLHGLASGRPLLASGLPADPPFDSIGAGRRIAGSAEAWAEAVGNWIQEWSAAGSPLVDWPWTDEGPGRAWIREHRTWSHSAAVWEGELAQILRQKLRS